MKQRANCTRTSVPVVDNKVASTGSARFQALSAARGEVSAYLGLDIALTAFDQPYRN